MEATKVAIVTGSSRGIGAETALLLAKNGYAVCVNYVSNSESAEHVANQITSNGGRSLAVRANVSSASDVKRLFKTVDAELGRVSVLVNNSGILMRQCRFDDISEERFLQVLRTNVIGCFLCSKEAIKRMSIKHGGHPAEVAEAILWLATDKSSFVTGSFIDTTGGL